MEKENIEKIEYQEKIVDVSLSKIECNNLNPRKRFVDTEADMLIDSILSKGLLNPIIVFKRKKDNKYVILDGERRYRAFKKLNYKVISCHVLQKEPTELENLSMMFHIHNVREEWTDFAIAQTLVKVIYEMGKDIKNLKRQDKLQLSETTSLSEYKINKYLDFFNYPQSVINKFMESELRETPIKGMDPDILAEMNQPLKIIEKSLPGFLKKYNKEKIIDACIRKKANDIIKTNRDFRLLTKSLKAMEKGNVRKDVMFEKLESFVKELSITPQIIFEDTSETLYQIESIIKKSEALINELMNLNLNQITKNEKKQLEKNLKILSDLLRTKLK